MVELKYRLMGQLGRLQYCDPDTYPLARPVTAAYVHGRISDIAAAEPQTYAAILGHYHLSPPLTGQQELQVYDDYKVLRAFQLTPDGDNFDFAYPIQVNGGWQATMTTGTIDRTGAISIQSRTPYVRGCPICLAASALIDTPDGPISVTRLRSGMSVWTQDRLGHRQVAVVIRVGSMPAPAGHSVVHLMLADGREVLVSPGHPTADGRHVGDLRPGDTLDGSVILAADRTPYVGSTYDLLPSGPTGLYWANGVLLASTLAS